MSQELKRTLPPAAKSVPISLVVKGETDSILDMDGMKVYTVGQSVRHSPHVLPYSHALNVDLLRGACSAFHSEGGAQMVHTHDWISSLAGLYLSTNKGVPLAISVYSTEVQRAGGLHSLMSMGIFDVERLCLSKARWVITANEVAALRLAKEYAIPQSKLIVSKSMGGLAAFYRHAQGVR